MPRVRVSQAPLDPVPLPGRDVYPCGCVATYHLAPQRTGPATRVRTVNGPCTARREWWTGRDFTAHMRDLGRA